MKKVRNSLSKASIELDLFIHSHRPIEEDEVFLEEANNLIRMSPSWHNRKATSSSLSSNDEPPYNYSSAWDHNPSCYDSSYRSESPTLSSFLLLDSPQVWSPPQEEIFQFPIPRTLSLTTVCSPRLNTPIESSLDF